MPAETHSHRPAPGRQDIVALVREQLAEILELDVDAVTLDARLREDLDADDYALLDLADAIENELGERSVGLHLDDDIAELDTVRDAVDCVMGRLRPPGANE
ncbi:MAG: acyl carrier protein [Actinomycetota bacterium]